MTVDYYGMIEQMADTGHAPLDGCRYFGVGQDGAFSRLERVYLQGSFKRGSSAEKFVVGPFGSGKTHFLRHLGELARELNCVTAEVALNKNIDFTDTLAVYQEMCAELRVPNGEGRGVTALVRGAVKNVTETIGGKGPEADEIIGRWIDGLTEANLKSEPFARVLQSCLRALVAENEKAFESCTRWLSGEVDSRQLCKLVNESPVTKSDRKRFAQRLQLALFQFVRLARFQGTVVGFDEAEQGLSVDRRKTAVIHSMLQASINAMKDLKDGSALIVYALTPDIVEKMHEFDALRQRVADPGPERGFFDGNTRAPIIDLSLRDDAQAELLAIGQGLVRMAFESELIPTSSDRSEVQSAVDRFADEVSARDASVSNRREMVKLTCSELLRWIDGETGTQSTDGASPALDEGEV